MEVFEALHTRRSVRRFTDEPVDKQTVEALLRAAMAAPSAANQQAWHFVVVDRRDLLDQIPTFHPYSGFLREAPLAVVVCGDLARERFDGLFWVQDCSAATQNLLVAAHALGLGGCWLAVYPLEERIAGMRRLLNLPAHLVPLNAIALGHPATPAAAVDRYDPSRISWNTVG